MKRHNEAHNMIIDSHIKKKLQVNRRYLPKWNVTLANVNWHNSSMQIRSLIAVMGIVAGFFLISMRLLEIVLYSDNESFYLNNLKTSSDYSIESLPVSRANIVDCNGHVLASTMITKSLYANPSEITDVTEVARKLCEIFPEIAEVKIRDLLNKNGQFVWLKRHLTPSQQLEVLKIGIPGIYLQRDERRVYVQQELVSHLVGLSDVDNNGIAGIESSYDDLLNLATTPLALTIDMRIQHVVRDELCKSMSEFKAVGAVGIMLDVTSGDVVSLVSLPDFNPNHTIEDPELLFNKASLGLYETGSTAKILTLAAAFEHGKSKFSQLYDATQPFQVAKCNITDFSPQNRWLTTTEVFIHSSNIGTARMALDLGAENQREFLRSLNLFDELKIGLPETAKPKLPRRWPEWMVATVSFGYGVSITPLHFASAISGIVNEGKMLPISLIKHKNSAPEAKLEAKQVVSKETSKKIRQLMRAAVLENAKNHSHYMKSSYQIGGKSGTAYFSRAGGYDKNNVRTMYVAAFPIEKPQYLVLVMLIKPQSTKNTYGYRTGNWNAAPTAIRIIERAAGILGVEPGKKEKANTFDCQVEEILLAKNIQTYRDSNHNIRGMQF